MLMKDKDGPGVYFREFRGFFKKNLSGFIFANG